MATSYQETHLWKDPEPGLAGNWPSEARLLRARLLVGKGSKCQLERWSQEVHRSRLFGSSSRPDLATQSRPNLQGSSNTLHLAAQCSSVHMTRPLPPGYRQCTGSASLLRTVHLNSFLSSQATL